MASIVSRGSYLSDIVLTNIIHYSQYSGLNETICEFRVYNKKINNDEEILEHIAKEYIKHKFNLDIIEHLEEHFPEKFL